MLYHASPRKIIPISKSLGNIFNVTKSQSNSQIRLTKNMPSIRLSSSMQFKDSKYTVISPQGIPRKKRLSLNLKERNTKYLEGGDLLVRDNPEILNIQNAELLNTSVDNNNEQQPSFLYSCNDKYMKVVLSNNKCAQNSKSIHSINSKNSLRQSILLKQMPCKHYPQYKMSSYQVKNRNYAEIQLLQHNNILEGKVMTGRFSDYCRLELSKRKVNINKLQRTKLKISDESYAKSKASPKLQQVNTSIKHNSHSYRMQLFSSAQFQRKLQYSEQSLLLKRMGISENWDKYQKIESQRLQKINSSSKKGLRLISKNYH